VSALSKLGFASVVDVLPNHNMGFNTAIALLEAYSHRNIRHDSDALNAIDGAISLLSSHEHPAYHTWAVPFAKSLTVAQNPGTDLPIKDITASGTSGASNQAIFALNWWHQSQYPRRSGFPSWSPLGWKGPSMFLMKNKHDYHSLQIPTDCEISIWEDGEYQRLDSATDQKTGRSSAHTSHHPQRLQITTDTIQLPLQYLERNDEKTDIGPRESNWYVRLPSRRNEDIFVLPRWGGETSHLQDMTTVLCVVMMKLELWVPIRK
jgi:hypothetical protein